ncbi:hypothetical protein B0H14DRAFT_2617366 [Mycena olivaceomarginata]|nr:hypothetical protein B0H14DRAFT_2617366 [Mycena olivaceomarginata]
MCTTLPQHWCCRRSQVRVTHPLVNGLQRWWAPESAAPSLKPRERCVYGLRTPRCLYWVWGIAVNDGSARWQRRDGDLHHPMLLIFDTRKTGYSGREKVILLSGGQDQGTKRDQLTQKCYARVKKAEYQVSTMVQCELVGAQEGDGNSALN